MNKKVSNNKINVKAFEEMLRFIDDCLQDNEHPAQRNKMPFNVDGILYQVSITAKNDGKIDLTTSGLDFLSEFQNAFQIINKKGSVRVKLGSKDTFIRFVVITTNQEIYLVRQSIASMTLEIF